MPTAPLQLTDASGKTLDVNPGKSFLAIWGGYYGQALRLLDGDGNEQALPEKPALLDSAVPDEAAEAAELEQQRAQALVDAQDKLNQAQTALNEALQAQQDAAGTADSGDTMPPASVWRRPRRPMTPPLPSLPLCSPRRNPTGTPSPPPTAPRNPRANRIQPTGKTQADPQQKT